MQGYVSGYMRFTGVSAPAGHVVSQKQTAALPLGSWQVSKSMSLTVFGEDSTIKSKSNIMFSGLKATAQLEILCTRTSMEWRRGSL